MDNVFIHPSAHVDPRAKIGPDAKIWINAQVREDAEIGAGTIISKDVYIDHAVKIGDRCKIQNSVSVYSGVTIGDDVFVGPNVAFTNDKIPRANNADWQITPTRIQSGASLGANSTIVCGVTVGSFAMVAAGAVVTKNVEDFSLVMGNPARHVGYVDEAGNRVGTK